MWHFNKYVHYEEGKQRQEQILQPGDLLWIQEVREDLTGVKTSKQACTGGEVKGTNMRACLACPRTEQAHSGWKWKKGRNRRKSEREKAEYTRTNCQNENFNFCARLGGQWKSQAKNSCDQTFSVELITQDNIRDTVIQKWGKCLESSCSIIQLIDAGGVDCSHDSGCRNKFSDS